MAPHKEVVLKLTSFRYKNPSISDKEFWEFGTKNHAPKAALVQKRHGAIAVKQVRLRNTLLMKDTLTEPAKYYTLQTSKNLILEKIPWVIRPGWTMDDADVMVSVYVRNTETLQAIIMDPDFQALVADDDKISLQDKARVTAGWEEVFLDDGEIVEPNLAANYEQRAAIGSEAKTIPVNKSDFTV